MKKIFLIGLSLCLTMALQAHASCLLGDAQMRAGRTDRAKISYETCALQNNDAQGQYALGLLYRDGIEPVRQNMKMALFYFRLAAENGYAPAQRDLAELMETLTEFGTVGQTALTDYESQMRDMNTDNTDTLSAFAWALLAAEKADNKWFYPSPALSDDAAAKLVKKWTSSKGTAAKDAAIQQATVWKEKRLVKSAVNLLSLEEYAAFMEQMYPQKNDAQTLTQKKKAMADLKTVWETRIK